MPKTPNPLKNNNNITFLNQKVRKSGATSQLDSITENEIQKSLKELMENKTSIVIAHRLSTLKFMDRILVFDNGKIVQDGNHKSLLKQKGLYKKMWDAQVGGFLGDESSEPSASKTCSDAL